MVIVIFQRSTSTSNRSTSTSRDVHSNASGHRECHANANSRSNSNSNVQIIGKPLPYLSPAVGGWGVVPGGGPAGGPERGVAHSNYIQNQNNRICVVTPKEWSLNEQTAGVLLAREPGATTKLINTSLLEPGGQRQQRTNWMKSPSESSGSNTQRKRKPRMKLLEVWEHNKQKKKIKK